MPIERARIRIEAKPWGVCGLRPWSAVSHGSEPIGELSFDRQSVSSPAAAILLKLLFTREPLSIQVHPGDAYAKSIGLAHGKSEAWYVLSAAPGAKVAVGLERPVTRGHLRCAIDDGSIAQLVRWNVVVAGDVISVPSGTIHAIGAGLVIAEIQQRSDTTFRLFDYGRTRLLHADDGAAAADVGMAPCQAGVTQLTPERRVLASNRHFVFEHGLLAADSVWRLEAARETWVLVIDGSARAAAFDLVRGDAIFAQAEQVDIRVGRDGVAFLVGYTGGDGPEPQLLYPIAQASAHTPPSHNAQPDPADLIGPMP